MNLYGIQIPSRDKLKQRFYFFKCFKYLHIVVTTEAAYTTILHNTWLRGKKFKTLIVSTCVFRN